MDRGGGFGRFAQQHQPLEAQQRRAEGGAKSLDELTELGDRQGLVVLKPACWMVPRRCSEFFGRLARRPSEYSRWRAAGLRAASGSGAVASTAPGLARATAPSSRGAAGFNS